VTELYTHSRLRVLRQCRRLHQLRYELGIQTPSTPEAMFGTVGHAALEAYYLAWKEATAVCDSIDMSDEPSRDRLWRAISDRLPAALAVADASELATFDRCKLRLLLIAYHERWGAENWEILAVEQEFRYALGDHLIGGKIDAIIRDRADGRVYVLEHKFTGSETSLGGPYWERLTLDSQVSIYIDGATMLGYDIAGCIYDVIKRPQHDQLSATPEAARKYTLGKGCKRCGGSAGGKAGIVQGRGHYDVVFASEVKRVDCDECKATGWKCDADGVPQAPRLHANQRDTDETIEQFEERLLEVIAEDPDGWLQRSKVVRLDDELPEMRRDVVADIEQAEDCRRREYWPRNPDACSRGRYMCSMFEACCGRANINDFQRGPAHPELASAT